MKQSEREGVKMTACGWDEERSFIYGYILCSFIAIICAITILSGKISDSVNYPCPAGFNKTLVCTNQSGPIERLECGPMANNKMICEKALNYDCLEYDVRCVKDA